MVKSEFALSCEGGCRAVCAVGARASLLIDPARPDARDYRRTWMTAEGHAYRMKTYERHSKYGTKPLDANPTFHEVRTAGTGMDCPVE